MAKLRIVSIGDPDDAILRKPTVRVRDFGPTLHKLLDDMVETMHAANGAGLAAPQIGLNQRVVVIEYPEDEERPDETRRIYELINPELIRAKGTEEAQEGCLSMPGLAADVARATEVIVRAQDRHGKEVRYKVYDWLARIFQHELDHLQGVLMSDRANQMYRLYQNEQGEIEAVPIEATLSSPTQPTT